MVIKMKKRDTELSIEEQIELLKQGVIDHIIPPKAKEEKKESKPKKAKEKKEKKDK